MLKRFLEILVLNFLIISFVSAQRIHPPDYSIPLKTVDTLCFQLHFDIGDTLIYNVFSYDSISINYDKPLKRLRLEKLRVVCESIDRKKRYHLSIELIEFHSKEAYKETKEQKTTDSPWLNRKVNIIIDKFGDRYYTDENDRSNYAMSPGGSFQPVLFFPFLRNCKPINSTWIVQSTDTLVENGLPVPLMKQVSLFRIHPPADTMGEKCAKLEYVKSGQGVVLSDKAGYDLNVTSIITGFGEYYISLSKHIPIYYFATIEQKLTIHLPNNKTQPGSHKISSYFTLESISKKKEKE